MPCGIRTLESLSISTVKGKKIRIKFCFSVKKIPLSLELKRANYLGKIKSISLYSFELFSGTCSLWRSGDFFCCCCVGGSLFVWGFLFCWRVFFFFETGKIPLGFQVVEENLLGPDHLAICEKEIGAAQRTFDFREGLTPLEPAVKWSNCVA